MQLRQDGHSLLIMAPSFHDGDQEGKRCTAKLAYEQAQVCGEVLEVVVGELHTSLSGPIPTAVGRKRR
jgi:hypothetical protein